jgi:hypothetical protein
MEGISRKDDIAWLRPMEGQDTITERAAMPPPAARVLRRHSMADEQPPVLPGRPEFRPLERFWPYADLPEQPSDEELAALHPELRAVLFGAAPLPFSISIVFPEFEGEPYARAVALAKSADEYVEVRTQDRLRHRARFFPGDQITRLRDLYELVADVPDAEVWVDDQPVPFARELWLPLVWCLIR